MMNRRGLGRGLDALLGSAPASAAESLMEVAVDHIDVNPRQPRKVFDPAALDELARSIKTSGVIQPIVVRRVADERWQLIAGERRWRAARQAGVAKIPAVVREATDAECLELALVENLLREDLNVMEEAEAFQQAIAEFGWTQEQLAQRVGRDRSSITNALRLFRLPLEIQDDLRAGRLTFGHALVLLSLTEPSAQRKLRDEILAHSWTVRAAEAGARNVRPASLRPRRRSPELAALEEALQRALMMRVRIHGTDRRGRVEIVYATGEDLERLTAAVGAHV
jgi:ParB family transcriptional regulator, chromosome partitioning protein